MADQSDTPDNATWGIHMRALRREQKLLLEQLTRNTELLHRVIERIDHLGQQVANLQSDVVLLENHNLSRHGEILNLFERQEAAQAETDRLKNRIAP